MTALEDDLRTKNNKLVKVAGYASLIVATFLLCIKFYALWKTSSMAILAGLLDSLLDLAASAINLIAIKWAIAPADDDHRFGHGKAEALAGLAQSTLIATSAILLVLENIGRLVNPVPVTEIDLGIWVTVITLVVTMALIAFQRYVISATGSLAVKADHAHYKNDIYLNIGVFLALIITAYTPYHQADPVIAMIVAVIILWGIKGILKQSFDQIMDKEFSEEKRERIFRLATMHDAVGDIHDLRTRMSGGTSFIQFHLELPPETKLFEAHRISDEVEDIIKKEFPLAEIFIHLDPERLPKKNPLPYTVH